MIAGVSAVLVLGMHRSGTSCLAGSLQQAGLELGRVFTRNPYNAKGNREHKDVMKLNDDVLEFSAGAWDRAPRTLEWTPKHAQRRDRFLNDLARQAHGKPRSRAVGFKDPRTLLTLDFWRDSGASFRYVGTFRHPARVARSLEARSGMSATASFELWHLYNERLLALHEQEPFPVISFDAPETDYIARVRQVIAELDLNLVDDAFFDASLRRSAGSLTATRELPAEVGALYERLLALS